MAQLHGPLFVLSVVNVSSKVLVMFGHRTILQLFELVVLVIDYFARLRCKLTTRRTAHCSLYFVLEEYGVAYNLLFKVKWDHFTFTQKKVSK